MDVVSVARGKPMSALTLNQASAPVSAHRKIVLDCASALEMPFECPVAKKSHEADVLGTTH